MHIEEMSREEILTYLRLNTANDFLDCVTLPDILEYIEIEDHWDANTAYERYGSELMDFFDIYDYIPDDYIYDQIRENWDADSVVDAFGDDDVLLTFLLNHMDLKYSVNIIADREDMLLKLVEIDPRINLRVSYKTGLLAHLLQSHREALVYEISKL